MKQLLPALALLLVPGSLFAASIQGNENVTIQNDLADDLYVAGASIVLDADIDGDVYAAGAEITLKKTVTEDVIAAGGNLRLTGPVEGDVRLAGGSLRLSGLVAEDAFVAGGQLEVTESAVIEGEARLSAGDIVIDGTLNGKSTIQAGRIIINGTITEAATIKAEEVIINGRLEGPVTMYADHITLGNSAAFAGVVTYWHKDGLTDFTPYLDGGSARFDTQYAAERHAHKRGWMIHKLTTKMTALVYSTLFAAVTIIVFALVFIRLIPNSAKELSKNFWKSVLHGFIYFAVTPVVCLLLAISILGLPFSALFAIGYGFSFVFALPLTALILTHCAKKSFKKKWGQVSLICWAIAAYVILKLLMFIPVIGIITIALLVCGSFGAVMTEKWRVFGKLR